MIYVNITYRAHILIIHLNQYIAYTWSLVKIIGVCSGWPMGVAWGWATNKLTTPIRHTDLLHAQPRNVHNII